MTSSALFLGTGASTGTPVIGCGCDVCQSNDLKNKRTRPSLLLEVQGKKFLIDPGPDFRQQALRYNIDHIDGVLITHPHYDHIGGIDDLRILYLKNKKPIPCLLSENSFQQLQQKFAHLFRERATSLTVQLDFSLLEQKQGERIFEDVKFSYYTYTQGNTEVIGYKCGDVAYITDIKEYKESIFDFLQDVNILILSALRYEQSPVQFNFDEAIDFARKTTAKKVYFTHISHEIAYEDAIKKLPSTILLAYDGLKIDFAYKR